MRKQRVYFKLDSGTIKDLSEVEIKAILRAADELITTGGRNLLGKILKGSKDKNVLEHELDQCPVYGFYQALTLEEIGHRVDWMIQNGYLKIEYFGRLPMLVFSKTGWEIERETYAEELLHILEKEMVTGNFEYILKLKDRNREIILLLIEKIEQKGNASFIPFLKAWKTIEYKKVQAKLQNAMDYLAQQP